MLKRLYGAVDGKVSLLERSLDGVAGLSGHSRNVMKVYTWIRLFTESFGRAPTKQELARITGLNEKTIRRIANDKNLKETVADLVKRDIRKSGLKKVSDAGDLPQIVPIRFGVHSDPQKGRPSTTYELGPPTIIRFLSELVSRAGQHIRRDPKYHNLLSQLEDLAKPEIVQSVEIWFALTSREFDRFEATIAYRLIALYAKEGKTWSLMLEMLKGKDADKTKKEFENIHELQRLIETLIEFSKCGAISEAFERWNRTYGTVNKESRYRSLLAGEDHDFDSIVDKILSIIRSEVRVVISTVMGELGPYRHQEVEARSAMEEELKRRGLLSDEEQLPVN